MALSQTISALSLPYDKCRSHESSPRIRAQSCRDEGRPRNIVDANLRILECRIEEARVEERLEKCYLGGQQGWSYTETEYENCKRVPQLCQSMKLVGVVVQTFGLSILSGTLGLCLAAIFLHPNQ